VCSKCVPSAYKSEFHLPAISMIAKPSAIA
jgi:hypothetical protein